MRGILLTKKTTHVKKHGLALLVVSGDVPVRDSETRSRELGARAGSGHVDEWLVFKKV